MREIAKVFGVLFGLPVAGALAASGAIRSVALAAGVIPPTELMVGFSIIFAGMFFVAGIASIVHGDS